MYDNILYGMCRLYPVLKLQKRNTVLRAAEFNDILRFLASDLVVAPSDVLRSRHYINELIKELTKADALPVEIQRYLAIKKVEMSLEDIGKILKSPDQFTPEERMYEHTGYVKRREPWAFKYAEALTLLLTIPVEKRSRFMILDPKDQKHMPLIIDILEQCGEDIDDREMIVVYKDSIYIGLDVRSFFEFGKVYASVLVPCDILVHKKKFTYTELKAMRDLHRKAGWKPYEISKLYDTTPDVVERLMSLNVKEIIFRLKYKKYAMNQKPYNSDDII